MKRRPCPWRSPADKIGEARGERLVGSIEPITRICFFVSSEIAVRLLAGATIPPMKRGANASFTLLPIQMEKGNRELGVDTTDG